MVDGRKPDAGRTAVVEGCSPERFREVLCHLVAGVSVVTTEDNGRPVGLTITSLTSYSSAPPSICLNVARSARSHRPLFATGEIGVHLLAGDQWPVAEVFSSRVDDKFAPFDWYWDTAVPRLRGVMAFLACEPVAAFHHGDHSILIAEVRRAELVQGPPLVYLQRSAGWQLIAAGH